MQDIATMRQGVGASQFTFVEGVVVAPQDGDSPIYARVRLPSYHTNVPDENLPLYRILMPCAYTGHNVNNLSKQYVTLSPGTRVDVRLSDKEATVGTITGVYANESSAEREAGLKHGWEDDIGNAVKFYDDGRITLTDKSGLTVETSGTGDLTINGINVFINAVETIKLSAKHFVVDSDDVSMTDTGTPPDSSILTPRELADPPETSDKKDW